MSGGRFASFHGKKTPREMVCLDFPEHMLRFSLFKEGGQR